MSALTATLQSLPYSQFKRISTFYVWYDSFYALAALTATLLLIGAGYHAPLASFHWWHLLLFPPFLYAMIMVHVFLHNASHGNFPRAINRLVGEVFGIVAVIKFASWEIVHRRHHRYSDDPERDPHPAAPGYWRFVWTTLIQVERQLQQSYFDLYGDTPSTRRYELWRARLSTVSGALVTLFWFQLLGASGFLLAFVPASVCAGLFVIHFNWVGHNAHRPGAKIEPVDLDYGWFWWGNRIFFGIYYHGTHHRLSMLFNPMKATLASRRATRSETTA